MLTSLGPSGPSQLGPNIAYTSVHCHLLSLGGWLGSIYFVDLCLNRGVVVLVDMSWHGSLEAAFNLRRNSSPTILLPWKTGFAGLVLGRGVSTEFLTVPFDYLLAVGIHYKPCRMAFA